MEYNKIKSILENVYHSEKLSSGWMKLPEKITIIFLNQDANIYINDNQIFRFNSEALDIAESNDFINNNFSHSGSYKVSKKIMLADIGGFISTSAPGPYGSYFTK